MAILIDLHQVVISSVQEYLSTSKIKIINEDLCRHLILNSIRAPVFKLKKDYGDVILCTDGQNYWRKSLFPYYKFKRGKLRESSDFDWDMLFRILNEIKADIKEYFPYKVIEVYGAEADDVIGTLAVRLSAHEPVVIVSTDGDFKQLQKYPNVKQYNKKLGVFIKSKDPEFELKEKIMRGDSGDGIPSIISNDTVFVEGIRQKPITKKRYDEMINLDFNDETNPYYRNIIRNKTLIDLSYTPKEIKEKIIEEFDKPVDGSKRKMITYFIEKKLGRLLECIDEF